MRQLLLSAAVFALLLSSAHAQPALKLEIKDGRVNLDATSVPARQILAEWANVGGTKVVGADKITGAPLTLKLVDVAERQALDIILRNVAGYMAAPRLASATPGASAYDRILILPTSVSAGAAASNNNASRLPIPGPMAGTERRVPAPPRPPGIRLPNANDDDPVEEPNDTADTGVNPGQPVFTFPQPQVPGNQVFVPVQQGANGQPGFATGAQPQITLQPGPNGQPTIYNFMPTGQAPSNPGAFTVIGSPTPGVIQQPQPSVVPGQPIPPKPPGGRN
jgi:hypothetical protein